MSFEITSKDYVAYLKLAAKKIHDNGEYISALDGTTGDGDHWANLNMGFGHLVAAGDEMETLPMDGVFKKIGMLMMSKVGGSSGVLYGGAYMAAAKALAGKAALTSEDLCLALESMVNDMCKRGKAAPGDKTMIDALYPAAQAYKACLAEGKSDAETMETVKKAAIDGAEATRAMEAKKGRPSYREDKAVGHLDPGAVTMSYQLECLCDYISANLL